MSIITKSKQVINNIIAAAKYGELTKTATNNFYTSISAIPVYNNLNYDTIKQMLGDDTISNCINSKKQTVLSKGWKITPAESDVDSPEYEKYKEQADFVEFCLTDGLTNMCLNDIIEEILTAGIILPLSITEINYIQEETKWGIKTIFKNFKTRLIEQLTRQFEVKYNDFGDIESVKQNGVNIPLEKLLLFKYQGENVIIDNFSKLYKYWYIKTVYENIERVYLELRSKIPCVIKGNLPAVNSAEYVALQTFLDNITEGGRGLLPPNYEIEFPSFTVSNFTQEIQNAIEEQNYKIRFILEKPMLLDKSGTVGSYSLSKNQLDDYYLNLQRTQQKLENIINEAIYRLIIINFPNETRFPKLKINSLYEEDEATKINKITAATDKGFITPRNPDDMNKAREYLGLWKFKEYEKEQEKQTDVPDLATINNLMTQYAAQNKNIKIEAEKENNTEIENIENQDDEKKMSDDATKILTVRDWQKPKFMSDKEIDEVKTSMEKIENEKSSDISLIAKKQIESLITYERIEKILKNFNIESIASLNIPYFSEMQNKFYQIINNYYIDTKRETKAQIKFRKLIDFVVTDEASEQVKKVLKLTAYNNTEKITSQILSIFQDNLKSGLLNGLTAKQVYYNTIQQIENKNITDAQVKTLLRTAATDSYNLARMEVLTDVTYGWEYSAVLDEVTTQQCRLLNGTVYRKDDPIVEKIRPANHYGCRSILVSIIFEDEFKSAQDAQGGANAINKKAQDALVFIPNTFGGLKNNNQVIK